MITANFSMLMLACYQCRLSTCRMFVCEVQLVSASNYVSNYDIAPSFLLTVYCFVVAFCQSRNNYIPGSNRDVRNRHRDFSISSQDSLYSFLIETK